MKMDLDEMRAAKWWEVAIPPVGTIIDVNKAQERKKYGWSPCLGHPRKSEFVCGGKFGMAAPDGYGCCVYGFL